MAFKRTIKNPARTGKLTMSEARKAVREAASKSAKKSGRKSARPASRK